jgi:hypothetical protein
LRRSSLPTAVTTARAKRLSRMLGTKTSWRTLEGQITIRQ